MKSSKSSNFFIILLGPTGVGKTEFSQLLSSALTWAPVEIVNGDMGQMYTPLSIGTAKPNLSHEKLPHHLFNIIDHPGDFTASDYRREVSQKLNEIWQRGRMPIVVGGSGFYIKSLFFPPHEHEENQTKQMAQVTENRGGNKEEWWNILNKIDPARASMLHAHDIYRIKRALDIWYKTGKKPSEFQPQFFPVGKALIIFLGRDKADLETRIQERTRIMLEQGWIDEVKKLSSSWQAFLRKKKLIGYPEIIDFIEQKTKKDTSVCSLSLQIGQQTRAYAKRQITFWRSLKEALIKADPAKKYIKAVEEPNLTFLSLDLYIERLLSLIKTAYIEHHHE